MWNTFGTCRTYRVGEYFHICILKAQIFIEEWDSLTVGHSQQKQGIYMITCGTFVYILYV